MSGHLDRGWETPQKKQVRSGGKTIRFSAEDIARIGRIMAQIKGLGVETDFSKVARYLILVGANAVESGAATIETETENVKRLKMPDGGEQHV